jgi:hypothetical protein|tara:strand:- start:3 stop:119 length:117 start_codon:yes stop_codon:yes gene_type:complete
MDLSVVLGGRDDNYGEHLKENLSHKKSVKTLMEIFDVT